MGRYRLGAHSPEGLAITGSYRLSIHRLFALPVESDFGSMRVTDVVRAAGMSTRSFYDHFESKEDLLIGLIDEAGAKLVAEFAAIFGATDVDPVAKVDRALAAYCRGTRY